MQSYNEKSLTIMKDNSLYEFVAYTTVGDREEQQDSFGFNMKDHSLLALLCDGMGGHNGGAAASQLAVNDLLNRLSVNMMTDEIPERFLEALRETDSRVAAIQDAKGKPLGAGTTASAILLQENNLYWCSVGDSRIYLIRGDEMIKATCDHNYRLILDRRLANREISQEDYEKENVRGDALVSFLGVGNLPMTDINQEPFQLYEDDMIVLTSDGLYKYLSENEIKNILTNFSDLNDAIEALDGKVQRGSKRINLSRDNMTTIIIKIKRSA